MPTSNPNPGCLAALFGLFNKSRSGDDLSVRTENSPDDAKKPLPYAVRDDFLTPAELSFYRVLLHITADQVTVCPKVRLADLFFVSRPDRNRRYFNYIVAKHIDFVLCAPHTMRPLLAIELDDASHRSFDRMDRDEFVDRVFADAHIPLVRVPARRQYGVGELRALLSPHIKLAEESGGNASGRGESPVTAEAVTTHTEPKTTAEAAPTVSSSVPVCPKCGLPMVLRTVAQGQYAGRQFYGCRNFPRCREVRAYLPVK